MVLHVPHMRCYSQPRCSVVGAHYLLSSSKSRTAFWNVLPKLLPPWKLRIRFGVLLTVSILCEPQDTHRKIRQTKNITNTIATFGRPGGLQLKSHPTWIVRACALRGPRPAQSPRLRPKEFSNTWLEFSNEICSASRPLSVMLLSLLNLRGPLLRWRMEFVQLWVEPLSPVLPRRYEASSLQGTLKGLLRGLEWRRESPIRTSACSR